MNPFISKIYCTTTLAFMVLSQNLFATSSNLGIAEKLMIPQETSEFSSVDMNETRVRIPLVLTPYKSVATKGVAGEDGATTIPQIAEQHVLRARIDKPNQFYVGDFRVETNPKRLMKKTGRYVIQLDVFRRYGEFGQLEELMGSVDLVGVLRKQEANVYVLDGVGKRKFRDKRGLAMLDVTAGVLPKIPEVSAPISTLTK